MHENILEESMKLIGTFVIIALLFSCQSKEQSVVISEDPLGITMRIYEISSKTSLSENSILKLKNFFQKNDSLVKMGLKKGKSLDKMAQWYYPSIDTIVALLAPLEKNDYMFYQKINCPKLPYISKLRIAVKYRHEMSLSHTQIEQLLWHSEKIEKLFLGQDYKYNSIERQYLTEILSEAQYKSFFIYEQTQQAEEIALQQWKQIRKHNLCSKTSDSLTIINQLYEFERDYKGILEYMSSIENHKGYDKERNRFNAHKPLPLLKLETIESFSHNKLLDIICKREVSRLTEKQIEQLLVEYLRIMQAEHNAMYEDVPENVETKFDRSKLEGKSLMSIVSHQQLEDYFEFISQKAANEQAKKYWDELKDYDFMKEKDSVQVINELVNYECRLAVADQWILLENSRKHLFDKEDILNGKPEVLRKKEEWEKKEKENKIVRF